MNSVLKDKLYARGSTLAYTQCDVAQDQGLCLCVIMLMVRSNWDSVIIQDHALGCGLDVEEGDFAYVKLLPPLTSSGVVDGELVVLEVKFNLC